MYLKLGKGWMHVTRKAVENLQGESSLGDLQFNRDNGLHRKKFAAVLREAKADDSYSKVCFSLQDVSDTGKLRRLFRYLKTGHVCMAPYRRYWESMI